MSRSKEVDTDTTATTRVRFRSPYNTSHNALKLQAVGNQKGIIKGQKGKKAAAAGKRAARGKAQYIQLNLEVDLEEAMCDLEQLKSSKDAYCLQTTVNIPTQKGKLPNHSLCLPVCLTPKKLENKLRASDSIMIHKKRLSGSKDRSTRGYNLPEQQYRTLDHNVAHDSHVQPSLDRHGSPVKQQLGGGPGICNCFCHEQERCYADDEWQDEQVSWQQEEDAQTEFKPRFCAKPWMLHSGREMHSTPSGAPVVDPCRDSISSTSSSNSSTSNNNSPTRVSISSTKQARNKWSHDGSTHQQMISNAKSNNISSVAFTSAKNGKKFNSTSANHNNNDSVIGSRKLLTNRSEIDEQKQTSDVRPLCFPCKRKPPKSKSFTDMRTMKKRARKQAALDASLTRAHRSDLPNPERDIKFWSGNTTRQLLAEDEY